MTAPGCRVTNCDHPLTETAEPTRHCFCLLHGHDGGAYHALCGHAQPSTPTADLGDAIPVNACVVCVDLIPEHEALHLALHYGDAP
jgi:hypothetical protein